MELKLNKIKEITKGAVRITEEANGFHFYRFTEAQEEIYKNVNPNFYMKSTSTAGIKLLLRTNSKNLFFKADFSSGSSRSYFSVDVFVDGKFFDCLKNFDDSKLPQNYTEEALLFGEFSKNFALGEGEKKVCVYLPWSAATVIREISVDDNSFVESIKTDKKLLAFGDSITQGYDALYPSNRYSCKLAEMIGAEEFNKGIGGEIFRPELAKTKEDFVPDYITVAYGTNDWTSQKKENFVSNCNKFFEELSKNYPSTKIFAITPIWRKYYYSDEYSCSFSEIGEHIKLVAEKLDNVVAIDGFDLVTHDENYFGDLFLHPNDKGFEHYAQNLYKEVKKYL